MCLVLLGFSIGWDLNYDYGSPNSAGGISLQNSIHPMLYCIARSQCYYQSSMLILQEKTQQQRRLSTTCEEMTYLNYIHYIWWALISLKITQSGHPDIGWLRAEGTSNQTSHKTARFYKSDKAGLEWAKSWIGFILNMSKNSIMHPSLTLSLPYTITTRWLYTPLDVWPLIG